MTSSALNPRRTIGRGPVQAALAALALCCSVAASAQTQITIAPTGTAIAWTNVGGSGSPLAEGEAFNTARVATRLVDGSGLSLDGQLVHEVGDNWVASNLTQQTGGLLIDLGANYQIGTLQIWALNDAGVFGNFSPATFDFYTTTDGSAVTVSGGKIQVADLSKFTQHTNNTSLPEAPHAAGYLGQTYTFGSTVVPSVLGSQSGTVQNMSAAAVNARYLFLDDLTGSLAFGGRMGFSEIQVYTFAAIPEPSTTAALIGAGVLLGAALRRRTAGRRR